MIYFQHPDQKHWDKIHSGKATTVKIGVSMDLSARYNYGHRAFNRDVMAMQPGHRDIVEERELETKFRRAL